MSEATRSAGVGGVIAAANVAVNVEVVCPSGLSGTFRKMRLRDLSLFTPQFARDGTAFWRLPEALWQETRDFGPYGSHGAKPRWPDVASADILAVWIRAIAVSYGVTQTFEYTCVDCKRMTEGEVDLSELDYRAMDAAAIAALQDARGIELRLSDGRAVRLQPPTGRHSARASVQAEDGTVPASVRALAALIVAMDGIDEPHPGAFLDACLDLEQYEGLQLAVRLDELCGGYQSDVVTACRGCGTEQRRALPLAALVSSSTRRGRASTGLPTSSGSSG